MRLSFKCLTILSCGSHNLETPLGAQTEGFVILESLEFDWNGRLGEYKGSLCRFNVAKSENDYDKVSFVTEGDPGGLSLCCEWGEISRIGNLNT